MQTELLHLITEDSDLTLLAIETLVRLNDPAMIPALTALVCEGSSPAASVLSQMGPSGRDALLTLLGSNDEQTVATIITYFQNGTPFVEAIPGLARALLQFPEQQGMLQEIFVTLGPSVVEYLLPLHKSPHLYVRRIVARILSYFRDEEAIEALVTLFHDEDEAVRGDALGALGSRRYTPLLPQIVPLLQDDHWCWRAALALGNMDDSSVVDALLETLSKVTKDDSASSMEVECIIEALGKLGDSRAIPAILPFLHADEDTQCVAANALTFLGHPDAKRFLLERLSTGSGDYGDSVADGLLHLGAPLVPELLQALEQDPTKMVLYQVLQELHDPRAIPCLTRLLAFDSQTLPTDHPLLSELQHCSGGLREETLRGMIQDTVRGAAAGVLGELGESSCVPALLMCLTTNTSDWSCYITIPHVLKKLGDCCAILPLTQALVNNSNNLNEAAQEALLSFGEQSTPALLEVLKHGSEALRLAALYTLAQLHDQQALPPIEQLAQAPHQPEYLRRAAKIALICITGELD